MKILLFTLLCAGCSGVDLLPSTDATKIRRTVDALSGCYTEVKRNCVTRYRTEKTFFTSKKVPYEHCTPVKVRLCPGEKGFRRR